MKNFKNFIEASKKEITFTFGRFSPPTIGHEKLMDKVKSLGGEYRIYASQSVDKKKNPLQYKDKIKYMKKMFPKHAKAITLDTSVRNGLDVLFKLYDEGYTDVNFVVGADRVKSFEFLKKYNGVEAKGKYYKFDNINIVSAGERDPDSDDAVEAMSASKLRAAAEAGDFKEFSKGMPRGFDAHNLFNDVRTGMGLQAIKEFYEHIQLPKKSDLREKFVKGEIFNVGDKVNVIGKNKTDVIAERGPNFLLGESGIKYFPYQLTEALSPAGINKATTIILKYLRKKTGNPKIFTSLGVEEFTNSKSKGIGVRFYAPGKKVESWRFNWKSSGGATMHNLSSIDIWTTGKQGPDNHVSFEQDVSLVQVLPIFVEMLKGNIKNGRFMTLPSDVDLNESYEPTEGLLTEMAVAPEDVFDAVVDMITDPDFSRNKLYKTWKSTGTKILEAITDMFPDVMEKQGRAYTWIGSDKDISDIRAKRDAVLAATGAIKGTVSGGSAKETYASNPEVDKMEADKERLSYDVQLEDLENLIKLTVSGASNALFVAGRGGIGKTFTVEKTLASMGMSDGNGYFKNTGTASAVGIYALLFRYKNEIILFDDSDDALKDQQSRNIIKAATDTKKIRKLVWNKMGSNVVDPDGFDGSDDELIDAGKIPRHFEFTGKIMFISNLKMDKLDPDGAIRTRAFLIDIDPTEMEIYDFMEKIVDKIPLDGTLHLDSETRKEVVQLIRNGSSQQTPNLRVLNRALNMKAGAIKAGVEIGGDQLTRMIGRYA
jgi:hypothetical protein